MTQEEYAKELVNCDKDICLYISSIKKSDYHVVDRLCEIFLNSEITNDGEMLIPTTMHLKIALCMLNGYSNEEKPYPTTEHDTMLAYLIYLNQTEDGLMYNKLLSLTVRRTANQVKNVTVLRDYVNKVIDGSLKSFPEYCEIKEKLNVA